MDLFKEEFTELALPKYQLQNHKIELKLELELVLGLIYLLLINNLRILRANLNKDLVQGFIKESKLLTKYLVLFILKKINYNIYILIIKNLII